MVKSCCAYNCTERFIGASGIKFHRFPKDPTLKTLWIQATRRRNFIPTSNFYLCSNHFKVTDYERNVHGNTVLKSGAIPSVFNFTSRKLRAGRKKLINKGGKCIVMNKVWICVQQ